MLIQSLILQNVCLPRGWSAAAPEGSMLIQKPICCSVNAAKQLIGYFVHGCKFILEINELDKNESSLDMNHDCLNLCVNPYKPLGQFSVITRDVSMSKVGKDL